MATVTGYPGSFRKMEKRELTTEEWKAEKRKKKAHMVAMQALPYEVKIKRAELRAREYIEKLDDMELNAHVSVGGLDSIVLLLFLRHIGIDVPAISVSALEDKSIQRIHRELGVISIPPGKPKVQILQEYGFPVISKSWSETSLWPKGLPLLEPTNVVEYKCGCHEAGTWFTKGGKDRQKNRAKTFPGIARAMAEQWAGVNTQN